jgi:hypothetical protein
MSHEAIELAIFSIFNRNNPEDEMKRAKATFEKVTELKNDSRDARSARMRLGLLCRAHLDKTFVAGAEQTAAWQELAMMAVAQGKPSPEPPVASCYQKIKSGENEVFVYLPEEYASEAFVIGSKYQRTELSAQQAIDAMQALANQISYYELKLEEPFQALRFLRDELEEQSQGDGAGDDTTGHDPSH